MLLEMVAITVWSPVLMIVLLLWIVFHTVSVHLLFLQMFPDWMNRTRIWFSNKISRPAECYCCFDQRTVRRKAMLHSTLLQSLPGETCWSPWQLTVFSLYALIVIIHFGETDWCQGATIREKAIAMLLRKNSHQKNRKDLTLLHFLLKVLCNL